MDSAEHPSRESEHEEQRRPDRDDRENETENVVGVWDHAAFAICAK